MISLIVSHYKNMPALQLVFKTLAWQTSQDFEAIVAEDDNSQECADFIATCKQTYSFDIQHVFHEKIGFRKCKILNDAVRVSRGEKLVFIDGDCILHKRFIAEYDKAIAPNNYYYGRRVWLNETITQTLLKTQDLNVLNIANLIRFGVSNPFAGLYVPLPYKAAHNRREIWGCNWGVLKEYVLGINGFDEDFTQTGYGEDLHIGWRLRKHYNLQLISLKKRAIQYHLHHARTIIPQSGKELYEQKIASGETICKHGLQKINL